MLIPDSLFLNIEVLGESIFLQKLCFASLINVLFPIIRSIQQVLCCNITLYILPVISLYNL